MKCPRCQGLMVRDQVYDLDGPYLHLNLWRCLNCGEIVDPAILSVRHQKDTPATESETVHAKHVGFQPTKK